MKNKFNLTVHKKIFLLSLFFVLFISLIFISVHSFVKAQATSTDSGSAASLSDISSESGNAACSADINSGDTPFQDEYPGGVNGPTGDVGTTGSTGTTTSAAPKITNFLIIDRKNTRLTIAGHINETNHTIEITVPAEVVDLTGFLVNVSTDPENSIIDPKIDDKPNHDFTKLVEYSVAEKGNPKNFTKYTVTVTKKMPTLSYSIADGNGKLLDGDDKTKSLQSSITKTVEVGTKVTVEAVPDKGYHFGQWYDYINEKYIRDAKITITATKDERFIASFDKDSTSPTIPATPPAQKINCYCDPDHKKYFVGYITDEKANTAKVMEDCSLANKYCDPKDNPKATCKSIPNTLVSSKDDDCAPSKNTFKVNCSVNGASNANVKQGEKFTANTTLADIKTGATVNKKIASYFWTARFDSSVLGADDDKVYQKKVKDCNSANCALTATTLNSGLAHLYVVATAEDGTFGRGQCDIKIEKPASVTPVTPTTTTTGPAASPIADSVATPTTPVLVPPLYDTKSVKVICSPVTQNVKQGETATFTANVTDLSGKPISNDKITYVWNIGGIDSSCDSATCKKITKNMISGGHAADVSVYYDGKSIGLDSCIFNVVAPPTVTCSSDIPADKNVLQGKSINFKAKVFGSSGNQVSESSSYAYKWEVVAGSEIFPTDQDEKGNARNRDAINGSFNRSGKYTMRVTASDKSTRAAIGTGSCDFNVVPPPLTVTCIPPTSTVHPGQTVTINAQASGGNPGTSGYSYFWTWSDKTHNGAIKECQVNNSNTGSGCKIPAKTPGTYNIQVYATDGTDAKKMIPSEPCVINVDSIPVLKLGCSANVDTNNKKVIFRFEASGGTGEYTFPSSNDSDYSETVTVKSGDKDVEFISAQSNNSVYYVPVQFSDITDNGTLKAFATVKSGKDTETATCDAPPIVTCTGTPSSAKVGEKVTFTATTFGFKNSIQNYTWIIGKNGTPQLKKDNTIDVTVDNTMVGTLTATLAVSSVKDESATATCTIAVTPVTPPALTGLTPPAEPNPETPAVNPPPPGPATPENSPKTGKCVCSKNGEYRIISTTSGAPVDNCSSNYPLENHYCDVKNEKPPVSCIPVLDNSKIDSKNCNAAAPVQNTPAKGEPPVVTCATDMTCDRDTKVCKPMLVSVTPKLKNGRYTFETTSAKLKLPNDNTTDIKIKSKNNKAESDLYTLDTGTNEANYFLYKPSSVGQYIFIITAKDEKTSSTSEPVECVIKVTADADN